MDWNQEGTESPERRPVFHGDEAERHLRHQCHDRGPCREDLARTLPSSKGRRSTLRGGRFRAALLWTSDGLSAPFGTALGEDASGYLWLGAKTLYRWKPGMQALQYFTAFEHPELTG